MRSSKKTTWPGILTGAEQTFCIWLNLTLFHSNIWSADEECELDVVWYAPAMGERKNTISANSKVPLFQKLGFL